jgi:hypothetical protein
MKRILLYTIIICLPFTLLTIQSKAETGQESERLDVPKPLKYRCLTVKPFESKVLNKISAAPIENNRQDEKVCTGRNNQDGMNKHGGFFFTMSSMAVTIILVIILL